MPTLIKTSGDRREVTPRGERFTFPELYELIDAHTIEYVWPRHTPSVMMVVDEDGRLRKKPPNHSGCQYYGGTIVGDIVVFTRAEYNQLLRDPQDPEVPELT